MAKEVIHDLTNFENTPLRLQKRKGVPMYDPTTVRELLDDGLDPNAAVLTATATMDGLFQVKRNGRLLAHGTQTDCDELQYDEDAPPISAPPKKKRAKS